MIVQYDRDICEEFTNSTVDSTVDIASLETSLHKQGYEMVYSEGNCTMGTNVVCDLGDEQPAECRLNVRMTAAL